LPAAARSLSGLSGPASVCQRQERLGTPARARCRGLDFTGFLLVFIHDVDFTRSLMKVVDEEDAVR